MCDMSFERNAREVIGLSVQLSAKSLSATSDDIVACLGSMICLVAHSCGHDIPRNAVLSVPS